MVHACFDFKLESAWSRFEFFRDVMEPAILESDGWREHLDERAAVAADLVGAESTNSMDKPLVKRERLSLFRIIRVLANEAKIDISRPTKAAEIISALTAELDDEQKVGVTTIASHLRRIREDI